MAKLIFHTYAEALFDVAKEENKVEQFEDEFKFVADTFAEYPDFFELFITPRVEHKIRKKIMDDVFSDKISREVLNFIKILIDKDRGIHIQGMFKSYLEMADEHLGIIDAHVESAVELTDDERQQIEKKLIEMTGKTIRMTCEINPKIIGGLVIKAGDKLIDGSLKNRLDDVKQNLAQLIV